MIPGCHHKMEPYFWWNAYVVPFTKELYGEDN